MIKLLLSLFKHSSNSFEGQQEGEKILLLIRRHPFTISTRLVVLILVGLVPIILGKFFFPHISTEDYKDLFFFLSSLWYLGLWLFIFHALTLYILNTVIVTDRRVIDRDQHGLFNQKVSELNGDRIQDVSTHVNGVVETFLGFGDVTVQTAASERQFIFHQVPRPEQVKDVIIKMSGTGRNNTL